MAGCFALMLAAGCANIVSPEGGPKDLRPPAVLQADPPDRSLNLHAGQVRITFDEFLELKDLQSQLFISPPLGETPEVHLRGKSMLVDLPDSLTENTTYTLYFGNAIRDITEGNVLKDFTYSFSTGPVRDSLEMKGRLTDAYSGEAVADALICLYRDAGDSLFTLRPPDYITRSRADGSFSVYNLPMDSFRVYALKDANANAYFDLPNEAIAFDALSFIPQIPPRAPDTGQGMAQRDSLARDSLMPDSMVPIAEDTLRLMSVPQPALRLFLDQDTSQRLLKAWVPGTAHIRLEFSNPVGSLKLHPLDTTFSGRWSLLTFNQTRDSIDLWLLQSAGDSLRLQVTDEHSGWKDTLALSLKERSVTRKPGRAITPTPASERLQAGFQPMRNFFATEPAFLSFSYPLDSLYPGQLWLQGGGDTLEALYSMDTVDPGKVRLLSPLKPGTEYLLICYDSAFRDIRGWYNDSTAFRLRTLTAEDAGSLTIELSGAYDSLWTVELMGPRKEVAARVRRQGVGEVVFTLLQAGKYQLRAYHDANDNGRWDSGFFKAGIQAERMVRFPAELNVRAKWELREKFRLNPE